jgi:hypothetical protein
VRLALYQRTSSVSLFLTSLAWRCEKPFTHHSSPSPSYPPHHCPFTPVEPGYGIDLFEDDYLFLLLVADLRMDPALRPRPVSSLTLVTLHNSTTHRDFFLSARGTVCFCFVFVFLFFVAWGGRGKCEGGLNSMYYRNPIKIMCTTRLNDGIFTVHRVRIF